MNKLIAFEGIDGVGKTTIIKNLKKKLEKDGINVIFYERDIEPSYDEFQRMKPFMKQLPVNASFLYYMASAIYKSELIKGALETHWVLCDRWIYSTIASHEARGAKNLILSIPKNGGQLAEPDFTFLITVPEKIRKERIVKRKSSNKDDLKDKRKMLQLLKRKGLIEIKNNRPIDKVVDKIYGIITQN